MRLGEEQIEFQFVNSMKFLLVVDCCYIIDEIENDMDDSVSNHIDDDPLRTCLTSVIMEEDETINEEVKEVMNDLNSLPIREQQTSQELTREEKIDDGKEDVPKIELKQLPSHLRYAFLDAEKSYPVIINASLNELEEEKLLRVLRRYKEAIGWTIKDIKGISPTLCMHKILMEDDYKPVVQPQRRLNPAMQEVVKKEIVKLLDAGIIYPISDSEWVSPIHVVPKKGGMTVIKTTRMSLYPPKRLRDGECA